MTSAECTTGIVVLGIGNLLLMDDGAGVHAVRQFAREEPPGVTSAEIGTAILWAQSLVESPGRLLIFDAMCAGGAPGTVYLAHLDEIEHRPMGDSLHNFTIKSFRYPKDSIVVAVEPELIDAGIGLTPALNSAIPRMISVAQRIIGCWQSGEQFTFDEIMTGVSCDVSGNSR